jgi:hypothetical protein
MAKLLNGYMVVNVEKGFRPERTGYFYLMATPWKKTITHSPFFALTG